MNNSQRSARFSELAISEKTRQGLSKCHFEEMTDIQAAVLDHALKGRDILATAKTGSGKTLAFLIPVLERLHHEKWSAQDGLGALIITPTRELALQVFEVLKDIGFKHDFSAGLVIGGKSIKSEQLAIGKINIIVATPGRMLQHLDQNHCMNSSNLKVLVFDEADRILDMGFSKTINAILQNLPKSRQTLLFSATLPKAIEQLATKELNDNVFITTYVKDQMVTPSSLNQSFIVCQLHEKLEILYTFIKASLKAKSMIFFSSCKQVRFVYEAFCKIQPGTTILALHGKLKQHQRLNVYETFCNKRHAILICTDIAARGLDFPSVDWILQVDCPESLETYVHRVGRTARYNAVGSSLILLTPHEKAFLEKLSEKGVVVNPYSGNISFTKRSGISVTLANICSQDSDIKLLAQKAMTSYIRSLYFQRANEFFGTLEDAALQEYSRSYGLAIAPHIRFTPKKDKNTQRSTASIYPDNSGSNQRKRARIYHK